MTVSVFVVVRRRPARPVRDDTVSTSGPPLVRPLQPFQLVVTVSFPAR